MKFQTKKYKNPFLIAEIGINHNGSIKSAKRLIDLAKETGFDAVKFQKRNPDISTPENQKSKIRNTPWGDISYLDYKKKIEFGLKEFKWLSKKTPELHTIASIKNDREQNMDAYEKKIEDRTSGLLGAHFGDIENLLKAFLENKIAIGISGNKALFEKNINILDGIISKALSVEKKIIRELQEKEKRYQEKANTQFQDWIKKYGYCTSNEPYEGSYPLTKSKLKSIKTKIKEEDDFQGGNWLEEINMDSDKIIRLQHLSKEEILYIKKNFVSADENNCDLEIERRSKLKLWEKLYEMIFIRI